MMQCAATVLIALYGLVIFSHGKENQCPAGKARCPDNYTCCVLSNDIFGCCPFQNAVCCGDSVHCCPEGYTCDAIKGICKMGRKSVPLLKEILAKPIMKVPATKKRALDSGLDGNISPDKKYQFPKESTCCKHSSGTYVCCPLKNAVCCSDHKYCCPEGYTCDVEAAGECIRFLRKGMFQKISALKTKISAALQTLLPVICPNGIQCSSGETCCQIGRVGYRCCPFPHAVCCADGAHCCPAGYNWNARSLISFRKSLSIAMPLKKATATKKRTCPDRKTKCFFSQTCCRSRYGGYDCCPHSHAVCCPDGIHCCRRGEICDLAFGRCLIIRRSQSVAILQKIPAKKKLALDIASDGNISPNKKYQFPKESNRCNHPSGTYGCCPLENALCGSYHIHCCLEGYTRDVEEDAELKCIHCPDECSCFDYETCCELADRHYGCCPSSKAVCCSDHEHCCPAGFRCDFAAEMCVAGKFRLPMLKKAKSPRRPKTQQVNLDEKIHFVPAQAHGGVPVNDNK